MTPAKKIEVKFPEEEPQTAKKYEKLKRVESIQEEAIQIVLEAEKPKPKPLRAQGKYRLYMPLNVTPFFHKMDEVFR